MPGPRPGTTRRLAVEIELVAERAIGRGAISAAVTSLARAAELTTSLADKRRRLFRAATLAYQLGHADVGDAHRAVLGLLADDEHTRLLLEELGETSDVGAGRRSPPDPGGHRPGRAIARTRRRPAGGIVPPRRQAKPAAEKVIVTPVFVSAVTVET